MLESLRAVSDLQILTDTDTLVAQDRRLTLRLLAHLHEIDRRKLYLNQGYSSMFDYCRTRLRLSEGSSMRRIRTSRCLAQFPELHPLLESGEVNLMSVALISRVLKPANATVLVDRIRGKSKREVEAVVAEYEPRTMVPRDRVRAIMVRVASVADAEKAPPAVRAAEASTEIPPEQATGTSTATGGGEMPAGVTLVHERRTVVQFAARDEFISKVQRVRALVWHRLPNATFEQLFELALDELIARRDPQERQRRRERRASAPRSAAPGPTATPGNRHVPVAVRDDVFVRDGFRCSFVGSDGRRCDASVALQVDHVRPVARGGMGTPENLRILCAQHNRFESERIMGSLGSPERARSRRTVASTRE